jgi:hypothetical protein
MKGAEVGIADAQAHPASWCRICRLTEGDRKLVVKIRRWHLDGMEAGTHLPAGTFVTYIDYIIRH